MSVAEVERWLGPILNYVPGADTPAPALSSGAATEVAAAPK
jgi:hypothetical protein